MSAAIPSHNKLLVRGGFLYAGTKHYPCAIGKGGLIAAEYKREGDGCTPIGAWRLRECWFRPDRLSAPVTQLPLREITPEDGWRDDPFSADYNRHIKLDAKGSAEKLWREDYVYDLIIPLGYNDAPILPGHGSAIFLHIARPGYTPTEGCVALAQADLLEVLAGVGVETELVVEAG